MTIDDLTMMRDYELRALATPEADEVLTTRSRAARRVVLTMARALGRIERKWGHLLPFRTDMGTIGIVDTTLGTAWDTTIPAGPSVRAGTPSAGRRACGDRDAFQRRDLGGADRAPRVAADSTPGVVGLGRVGRGARGRVPARDLGRAAARAHRVDDLLRPPRRRSGQPMAR